MTLTLIPAYKSILPVVFLLTLMSPAGWTKPSLTGVNAGARQLLQEAIFQEEALGSTGAALDLYDRVISVATSEEREVAAKAQLRLGLLYQRLQRGAEAQRAFANLVVEYGDQHDIVRQAQARMTRPVSRPGESGITARRLWSGPGVDLEGTPSSDGSFLTYTDWRTGDLAIHSFADGEERRLTDKGSWQDSQQYAGGSTPSPDGKLVAYGWNNTETPGAAAYELRIIGVDGSAPRVLYRNPSVDYLVPHAWSPDGTQILAMFVREDETSQIVMVSLSDGSVRVLKSFDWRWSNNRMHISPDGRYIAYDFPSVQGVPERDLFLLATDGSREVPLVEHPADDKTPVWTRDGKSILFASDRTGAMGLWMIDVADGVPNGAARLVRNQMGPFIPLSVSVSGAYYYGRATGRMNFYKVTLDQTTDQPLASPAKLVQRIEGTSRLPAWSPDGQYLAYMRASPGCPLAYQAACSADDVLIVRSLESGAERHLSPELNSVRGIRWSPDGDWLLLIGIGPQRRPGIYRVGLASGATRLLVLSSLIEVLPVSALPVISQDGSTMYHVRIQIPSGVGQTREEDRILAHNLNTGEERAIYQGPVNARIMSLALAPDGRRLAFSESGLGTLSASVKVIPVAGGETRELYASSGFTSILSWRREGGGLLVQVQKAINSNNSELWRISPEGGEPVRVDLPVDISFLGRNVSVHPDGRQIVFSAGQLAAEVWVLDNIMAGLEAAR